MGPAQPSRSSAYTMGEKVSPASSSTYWKLLFRMTDPSTNEAWVTAMAAWHRHTPLALSGGAASGVGARCRAHVRWRRRPTLCSPPGLLFQPARRAVPPPLQTFSAGRLGGVGWTGFQQVDVDMGARLDGVRAQQVLLHFAGRPQPIALPLQTHGRRIHASRDRVASCNSCRAGGNLLGCLDRRDGGLAGGAQLIGIC